MALSAEDEQRLEAEVARMVAELRLNPNQEKEDRVGLELSLLPEEERAFIPTVLLRFLIAERRGEPLPDPAKSTGLPPRPKRRRRFAWSLRPPR
jgi:hypothetical protein